MINIKKSLSITLLLTGLVIYKSNSQKKEKDYNLAAQYLIHVLYYNIPKTKTNIGFINQSGKVIVPATFSNASDFFGDYANIIQDTTYGYVDKKGKVKLFPGYQDIYWFYSNVGVAKKGNKYGLIDREGKEITSFKFDQLNIPSEGYYRCKIGTESNFIDQNGKFLFSDSIKISGSFIYDSMTVFEKISPEGKYLKGMININSKIIIPAIYDELTGFFYNGLMRVRKNGKYGYINIKGEQIIPIIYDDLGFKFSDGVVTAKRDGKWGIINAVNQVIIPFEYAGINAFKEDLAMVRDSQKYGYINQKNELIIPLQFELIWQVDFSEGLAAFKSNKKYGFIDKSGRVVLPAIYDMVTAFKNGIAHVKLGGKANCIDKNGKLLLAAKYTEIYQQQGGLLKFIE